MSVKTVAHHLTHVYAKLDIRTRRQLAALLGARSVAPAAAPVDRSSSQPRGGTTGRLRN
jgi:hypothetical protein